MIEANDDSRKDLKWRDRFEKRDPNLDGERSRWENTVCEAHAKMTVGKTASFRLRWMRLEKQVPLERCGVFGGGFRVEIWVLILFYFIFFPPSSLT